MMKQFVRTMLTVIGLAVAAAILSSIPAQAQFLFVDCSGQTPPPAFPSISSALFALQTSSPPSAGSGAFIGVTGQCNENVFISGALNLFLAAFGPVTLNGNLSINNSENVSVFGLNVTNNFGDGIDINSSRSVVLDSCTSNGNARSGLFAGQSSDVAVIANGAFSNNGFRGLDVESNSFVNIVAFAGTVEISNNQSAALWLAQANFQTGGNTNIASNGHTPNGNISVAIDIRGGGKAQMGSIFGPNVIDNNPNGAVSLQENAEISFFSILPNGQNTISNNGPFGVKAGFGSQVTLAGAQITGHSGPGVDIYAHSQLYGTSQLPGLGATQIQNNGTAGDPLSAGIRVDGNSETLLRGVTISQNNGPAILALVNSSVDFAGNTFNANAGVITCDSTSAMVSDLAIAARTPAAGVICATSHTLGNRVVSVPAPAVPDISVWKKLHTNYQQRLTSRK
jgi:Right handed beta helix region